METYSTSWNPKPPLTVNSPAPIHSYKLPLQSEPDASLTASTTTVQGKKISSVFQPVLRPISNNFIKILWELVKDLPATVPEASEFNRLVVFGGNPKEFDDPTLDADELWETTLNSILKSTLGWGNEGNMDDIIRRGKWGLDGLVNFATYFVEERGVSGELFEGKLTNLVMALRKR